MIGENNMTKQCNECGKKIGIFSNGGTTSKGLLCNKCFKNFKREIKDEIKIIKKTIMFNHSQTYTLIMILSKFYMCEWVWQENILTQM